MSETYICPLIKTCTRIRKDSGFKLFCNSLFSNYTSCTTYRKVVGINDDREMLPKEWLKREFRMIRPDRTEDDYLIRVKEREIVHGGFITGYPKDQFINEILDIVEKLSGVRYVHPEDVPDCDNCERIDPDNPPERYYEDGY